MMHLSLGRLGLLFYLAARQALGATRLRRVIRDAWLSRGAAWRSEGITFASLA